MSVNSGRGFIAGKGKQASGGPGESARARGIRNLREGGKLGEAQLRAIFRPPLTGNSPGTLGALAAARVWVIARKHLWPSDCGLEPIY